MNILNLIHSLDWAVIASIAVVAGVGFAGWQLREANRTRSLDAFQAISETFEEHSKDRSFVYKHCEKRAPKRAKEWERNLDVSGLESFLKRRSGRLRTWKDRIPKLSEFSRSPYSLTVEQAKEVENVCVIFDRMGVLVKERLIPKKVAFSMYFDVVLRTWYLVEPFIRHEREQRQNDLWMMYFEDLAEKCWQHWKKLFFSKEWEYLERLEDLFKYGPCPSPFGQLSD
jgi:hypothetical protein